MSSVLFVVKQLCMCACVRVWMRARVCMHCVRVLHAEACAVCLCCMYCVCTVVLRMASIGYGHLTNIF